MARVRLGERLRAARIEAGLSAGELAAALGVGVATVGRVEAGVDRLLGSTLRRWLEVCGVDDVDGWLAASTTVHGAAGEVMSVERVRRRSRSRRL